MESYKAKELNRGGGFSKYRAIYYGNQSIAAVIRSEMLALLIGSIPGALGLVLRKWLYPLLFKSCGKGVVFGRNLTLRHAHKVRIGDHTILDDGVVLDAKGDSNTGITIGARAYIGRNTIIYCKNGDIEIGDEANISSNCQLFSSNRLEIGKGTVIAAFVYLLSGGRYDYRNAIPFASQSGTSSRGPTTIGTNCWLGAHVVVVDGVSIGDHCVVGAGAVVAENIPDYSLAIGVPAKPKPLA